MTMTIPPGTEITLYRVTEKFRGPRVVKAVYVAYYTSSEEWPFHGVFWECRNWYRDKMLRECFPHQVNGGKDFANYSWRLARTQKEAWDLYEESVAMSFNREKISLEYHKKRLHQIEVRRNKDIWNGGKGNEF